MKSVIALALIAGLGLASAASAAPQKLSKEQMDKITAGAITTTTTQLNGGGNTPQGSANGVPIVTTSVNPTGKAPPGQN